MEQYLTEERHPLHFRLILAKCQQEDCPRFLHRNYINFLASVIPPTSSVKPLPSLDRLRRLMVFIDMLSLFKKKRKKKERKNKRKKERKEKERKNVFGVLSQERKREIIVSVSSDTMERINSSKNVELVVNRVKNKVKLSLPPSLQFLTLSFALLEW